VSAYPGQVRTVSPALVRRLCLASLVANAAIVVTGGAVRLTSSGLGCPTWPRCTDTSFTPTSEYAAHGLIEFGNRTLTGALGIVVLATLLATLLARPRRRDLPRLAVLLLLGVPAQAVIGGITVLQGLNPWTVAAHFLVSMVLIAIATALWHRSGEPEGPARVVVHPLLRRLAAGLLAVVALTLVLGTVVTGSGPHAGDAAAARNGFDPATVAQLHADAVLLLIGLSVGLWAALRATGAPRATVRAAGVLLAVELAQGAVGYVQYFTDLPVVLVAVHLAGACLVLVAAVRVWLATRVRMPAQVPAQGRQASQLQPA